MKTITTHLGLDGLITLPGGTPIFKPACKPKRLFYKTRSSQRPGEVTCPRCKRTDAFKTAAAVATATAERAASDAARFEP